MTTRLCLGLAIALGLAGCGGVGEPSCEPGIGIEMAGTYHVAGFDGPNLFVGFDSVKAEVDGPDAFSFLTDVLIHGQSTAGASAVWRITLSNMIRPTVFTFQLAGPHAGLATIPITGGPSAFTVGHGPSVSPAPGLRLRLDTALGLFDGVDGTFTVSSTSPLTGHLEANLQSQLGGAGQISADLGAVYRTCSQPIP